MYRYTMQVHFTIVHGIIKRQIESKTKERRDGERGLHYVFLSAKYSKYSAVVVAILTTK